MQNIKYNNKDYTFFNTGEHYFTEKISYPLKQYDGYTVVSIFCDEISYINTKPIIIDASSMNIKYNRPGNVFIPIDENEEYYDIGKHIIELNNIFNNRNTVNDKLLNNYSLLAYNLKKEHYFSSVRYDLIGIYTNKVPVVSEKHTYGMSLEENASLKLKRYLK